MDRQQTFRDILELVTQAENQFDIHFLVCVSQVNCKKAQVPEPQIEQTILLGKNLLC